MENVDFPTPKSTMENGKFLPLKGIILDFRERVAVMG